MSYANIIVNVKARQLDRLFTYLIPARLRGKILVGQRVVVPFGRGQYVDGLVWSLTDQAPTFKVKPIVEKLADSYALSVSQLQIMQILRRRYAATYQEAYLAVLPSVQKLDKIVLYSVVEAFDDYLVGQKIAPAHLKERYSSTQIAARVRAGQLLKQLTFEFKYQAKQVEWVRPLFRDVEIALADFDARAVKKRRIIKHIAHFDEIAMRDLTRATRAARRDIIGLAAAGLVAVQTRSAADLSIPNRVAPAGAVDRPLSTAQQAVVADYMALRQPRAALLIGVTGSGKTRVYIELAKRAIAAGHQVLVLVPEIALTPQLVNRFSSQLTADIGVIHTYIRPAEKVAVYNRVKSGDIKVVIGARSAIFAPFKQLGLIAIDEEHEYSYKSETIPRYQTVELALQLAAKLKVDIILGSATPSIQTHHLIDTGALKALHLDKSFGQSQLSDIKIVDMTALPKDVLLSPPLQQAMARCFERGEQVILFHNRKGYAHAKQCRSCGYVEMCQNCAVPLTVYDEGRQFVCRYCGYRQPQRLACPSCAAPLVDIGYGIEQIQQKLTALFPTRRFVVVDSDLTHKPIAYRETLAAFQRVEIDCLIGTQILAKGLDFANVTLVGVVLADQLIQMPDYLSLERSYQLLTQVAGRAGRGLKRGLALIQTYQPDHRIFDYVIRRDFAGFVKEEKQLRDIVGYPPYVTLFTVKIQSESKLAAHRQADLLYDFYDKNFRRHAVKAQVFQPIQPFYARIRQQYRTQVLFKVAQDSRAAVLKMLYYGIVQNKYDLVDANCWVDIDFDG